MYLRTLIILSLLLQPLAAKADITAGILGLSASVVMHEFGHALTARAMNWKVVEFRPFPSRIPNKDGGKDWVMGYVMSSPPDDHDPALRHKEESVLLAMGSGTNVLSVLAFAPLLSATKGYGAKVLDQFLIYSAYNWPAYVLSDILFQSQGGTGDWRKVSQHTGISIYWYFATSVVATVGLVWYLDDQRKQARDGGSFGVSREASLLLIPYSVTF